VRIDLEEEILSTVEGAAQVSRVGGSFRTARWQVEVPYVGMRVVARIIRRVVLETDPDKNAVGVFGIVEQRPHRFGAQSISIRGDGHIDGFHHLFIVARTDGKINFIFDSNIKWTIMIKNRNDVHVAAWRRI
jgi:hypothetical protein